MAIVDLRERCETLPENSRAEDESALIRKKNEEELAAYLDRCLAENSANRERIEELKALVKSGNHSELFYKLNRFRSLSEHEFLFLRGLHSFFEAGSDLSKTLVNGAGKSLPDHRETGKTVTFESTIEVVSHDCIRIDLPALAGKTWKENYGYAGLFLQNTALDLIVSAYENGELPERFTDVPAVVFEHHLNEKECARALNDPDNIEAKRLLDALDPFILTGDSIGDITLIHHPVKDNSGFTRLYIVNGKAKGEWLAAYFSGRLEATPQTPVSK